MKLGIYYCVVCMRAIFRDADGLFIHDDVVHPQDMAFDEDKNPQ